MIGLDTNVLVRYLTQDDPEQAALATGLIERALTDRSPGFIGLVVLVETLWVLQRLYRATDDELRDTLRDLLGSPSIVVQHRDVVSSAVELAATYGGSLPDAIIAASAADAGCTRVVTFDRGAVAAGMTLLA
jgi:predicted nucleic-acid-binding protein